MEVTCLQGRLVNLSCSSVPSFVVSVTSATQVSVHHYASAFQNHKYSLSEDMAVNLEPSSDKGNIIGHKLNWETIPIIDKKHYILILYLKQFVAVSLFHPIIYLVMFFETFGGC